MRSSTPITVRRATLTGATPVIRHGINLANHNETLIAARLTRQGICANHNETMVSGPVIRHGAILPNHNETLVGGTPAIRLGVVLANHNETLVRAAPVIRHGAVLCNHNEAIVDVRTAGAAERRCGDHGCLFSARQ